MQFKGKWLPVEKIKNEKNRGRVFCESVKKLKTPIFILVVLDIPLGNETK